MEIVYGACYHLLSDYERRMDPVDLETVSYRNACEAFAVGLHAVCHRPRLRTDDRPPPKCDFPECLVTVEAPPQLSQQHMAVMALWLRWDPFTDRMAEFDVSGSPEMDGRDLWQYSADAWDEWNRITRELDEDRGRAEKELWMSKMREKLKGFEGVDRNHYPDDLKAYVDELEGKDGASAIAINEYMDEEEQEPEECVLDEPETKKNEPSEPPSPPEQIKSIGSIRSELEKTPSQIIEKRQLEQMERVSNSLMYPEKSNELNPRR